MRFGGWRKLDLVARQLVPCASILVLLVAGLIPLHLPGLHAVAPALAVIAVFYWTLYRPDLIPPFAVFVLGVLRDILLGQPLGISACVLVLVHIAAHTQRRFFIGKSFGVIWLGFSIVAAGALMVAWVLTCIYYGLFVLPYAAAFQVLTTIGFYPLLCRVLRHCQLSLLKQA